jgi:orotidine-5'-phosphate decarboxylase
MAEIHRWRAHAEELRTAAEEMANEVARDAMLDMAEGYGCSIWPRGTIVWRTGCMHSKRRRAGAATTETARLIAPGARSERNDQGRLTLRR